MIPPHLKKECSWILSKAAFPNAHHKQGSCTYFVSQPQNSFSLALISPVRTNRAASLRASTSLFLRIQDQSLHLMKMWPARSVTLPNARITNLYACCLLQTDSSIHSSTYKASQVRALPPGLAYYSALTAGSLSALLKLVKHQHWTIILGYATFVETNRSNLFWIQCNQLLATSFETLSQAGLLINHISWWHHLPLWWKQKFSLVLRSFNVNWLHFVFSKAPKWASVRNKGTKQQTARVTVQMSSNNSNVTASHTAHKYCPLLGKIPKWYPYTACNSNLLWKDFKRKKSLQTNENTHKQILPAFLHGRTIFHFKAVRYCQLKLLRYLLGQLGNYCISSLSATPPICLSCWKAPVLLPAHGQPSTSENRR